MSTSAVAVEPASAVAQLPAEVQNLVTNASSKLPGNTAFGSNEAESKEIAEWLAVASSVKSKDDLKVRQCMYTCSK